MTLTWQESLVMESSQKNNLLPRWTSRGHRQHPWNWQQHLCKHFQKMNLQLYLWPHSCQRLNREDLKLNHSWWWWKLAVQCCCQGAYQSEVMGKGCWENCWQKERDSESWWWMKKGHQNVNDPREESSWMTSSYDCYQGSYHHYIACSLPCCLEQVACHASVEMMPVISAGCQKQLLTTPLLQRSSPAFSYVSKVLNEYPISHTDPNHFKSPWLWTQIWNYLQWHGKHETLLQNIA